jgi:ABC-type hemin transport system ATPase subunit
VLLADGRIRAQGRVSSLLTSERLSDLYGVPLEVACRDGRWSAVAATD